MPPAELAHLKANEPHYRPSDEVKRQMKDKYLIALIGPSAVGKSTIAKSVIRIGGSDFSEAYSSITRPRRADDPTDYQTADEGFTVNHAIKLIHRSAVTNYSIHPSGNIYATLPGSFPAKYNLLPLLPGSLSAMKEAGFKKVHAIYIVTSTDSLKAQLADRVNDPTLASRLAEGRESLEWALRHVDMISFVENPKNNQEAAARTVISLLTDRQTQADKERGIAHAKNMLSYLRGLQPGGGIL